MKDAESTIKHRCGKRAHHMTDTLDYNALTEKIQVSADIEVGDGSQAFAFNRSTIIGLSSFHLICEET